MTSGRWVDCFLDEENTRQKSRYIGNVDTWPYIASDDWRHAAVEAYSLILTLKSAPITVQYRQNNWRVELPQGVQPLLSITHQSMHVWINLQVSSETLLRKDGRADRQTDTVFWPRIKVNDLYMVARVSYLAHESDGMFIVFASHMHGTIGSGGHGIADWRTI